MILFLALAAAATGPWDVPRLQQVPAVEWIERSGTMRSLYYANEPYRGKPSRIYAVYAVPEGLKPGERVPAMVLVHGGGGRAFPEWAALWAKRGYAAIAMDLGGRGADNKVRLPDGGPDQDDQAKFGDMPKGIREMWPYHAVAAVIRAASVLAAQPEVDATRIGITGISWGGYLTSLVSGLDSRLEVAIPVYGCGFLHENSAWSDRLRAHPQGAEWTTNFDPKQYLPHARMPMLWVNGTNDFAYPLDSYQKSYRLPHGPRTLCVKVAMKHSHPDGWKPDEIGLFADSVLRKGGSAPPLPRLSTMTRKGDSVSAKVSAKTKIARAEIHYTASEGKWQERKWTSAEARLDGGKVRATVPTARPLVYFLTVTDERGATVSTEHDTLPAAAAAAAR